MTTHSSIDQSLYSDWHPHFTPAALSERLTSFVPTDFAGTIIDPACGAGNLLAAAALRTGAADRNAAEIQFVGSDTSVRAVRECQRVLGSLLPAGNFRIEQADFLKDAPVAKIQPAVIVMNPPFRGYGLLSKEKRNQISRLQMKGRVNLGYAFVKHALVHYRPTCLVSLLPSNWIYTRRSSFRSTLDAFGGKWEWQDVGDDAFVGIDVHLGILLWRNARGRQVATKTDHHARRESDEVFEVRQGVATGRDALFCGISDQSLPFGVVATAVRGRDIGRKSGEKIWVPPNSPTPSQKKSFRALIARKVLDALRSRHCVKSKKRSVLEYHEAHASWFLGTSKLLLPEIVTKTIRVEVDSKGSRFPLHSVIAIRVNSASAGRSLKSYLQRKQVQRVLLKSGPRLNGGSSRLQVGAVRDVVAEWAQEIRKARKRQGSKTKLLAGYRRRADAERTKGRPGRAGDEGRVSRSQSSQALRLFSTSALPVRRKRSPARAS